jgi:two-component system sensor kinase FixL
MSKRRSEPDTLRSEAEGQLIRAPLTDNPARSAEGLLHELQVYQVELEMQNETLRQSQVTLEESRDRYVDFYDFAPVGYLTLSRDALITEINLTGATLLGAERSKLVNRRFAQFVASGDLDLWQRHFMAVLRHDSKQSCELEVLRGDGSRMYVQLDSLRLVKEGQAPVVRIVLADIAERKFVEAALRESEDRRHLLEQQAIVQTSLDGFWVVRAKDAQILEVNDACCDMMGYSREELLTMCIHDLEAIETPEKTEAHIQKIMATGYDRFETCQRHKQGHWINLEISTTYTEINGGIFFAFIRDITERKLAEEERRVASIAFESQEALMVTDTNNVILRVNRAFTQMTGYSKEEALGKTPAILKSGRQDKAFYQHMWATLKQKHYWQGEIWNKRKDGDVYPEWLAISAVVAPDGRITHYIGAFFDITERKKMEIEIMERRKEMEYLQKLKIADQTAAAIAHELNQPLLAIASYSKAALMLMEAEKPDYEEIYKAIEGGERQAHRAGQSMRELLEFLRMKEFPSEAFDLNKEIHNSLNAAQLEYELQFASILQQEEGLPLVMANRTQVQKVIFNLLCNGIEAMQESAVSLPAITVTVRTMKDGNVAQVTIQDNGPGVKKENFHRLFEPFFTTKAKGIGMGLAVSRSLIEANGGLLWIDPQEGCGATFHLTLPFAT